MHQNSVSIRRRVTTYQEHAEILLTKLEKTWARIVAINQVTNITRDEFNEMLRLIEIVLELAALEGSQNAHDMFSAAKDEKFQTRIESFVLEVQERSGIAIIIRW